MEIKKYLDYTAPELGYPWLSSLSRQQWNTGLDQARKVLDALAQLNLFDTNKKGNLKWLKSYRTNSNSASVTIRAKKAI